MLDREVDVGPAMEPWLAALGGASADRKIPLVQAALQSPAGQAWRNAAGAWVIRVVPVETLVPESSRRWRPLVQDAIQFVFSRLSDRRLAAKLVEQMELPPDTSPEKRLIRLISKMPGLQKIGQVLARNRHLPPKLRTALIELENGMSDITGPEVRALITSQLGDRLERYQVVMADALLSEASVSAVIGFTWRKPGRERERAVFKVLKPYVPECFAEDMALLQALGNFLTSAERGYGFAASQVNEMLTEVRLLLERELDFGREQATLAEAARTYRSSIGIRVPRVVQRLSTAQITAMSEETGVKVTDAFPRSPIRRSRIAGQLIEALIAVPLFSGQDPSVFHADPHAGNLLYDEANRELIVLDWALAERLSLESRRQLVMLSVMMVLQNPEGVCEAIRALRRPGMGRARAAERRIDRAVKRFFETLPAGRVPGVLDAMRLLDEIALQGVHFAAPLFLFRKSLFTLHDVLQDVAGTEMRMDYAIIRHFLTRWAASFGLFYAPLGIKDFLEVEWNALLYPARSWKRRLLEETDKRG
jgi:predicted unusual protein kinase regulating ubiquinone biosynthesis (AarF/ABC1/UbiB family)